MLIFYFQIHKYMLSFIHTLAKINCLAVCFCHEQEAERIANAISHEQAVKRIANIRINKVRG